MLVALIIACEVAFWVLLALGLALRYLAKQPRLGAIVLLCEPLLELVLLIVTAVDLKNGAEPDWKHGLAAVYIGFTVTHGHYMIKWADGHFAHRFAGGPPPVKPPKYGMARALHEWKMGIRAILAAGIAAALLQAAVWYVGDDGQATSLRAWQAKMGLVAGVSFLIALGYTVWPKKAPAGARHDTPADPRHGHGGPEYGAFGHGGPGHGGGAAQAGQPYPTPGDPYRKTVQRHGDTRP